MVPPTRIFHCANGHQICETCKYKYIFRNARNNSKLFSTWPPGQKWTNHCAQSAGRRSSEGQLIWRTSSRLLLFQTNDVWLHHLISSSIIHRSFFPILARHQSSENPFQSEFASCNIKDLKRYRCLLKLWRTAQSVTNLKEMRCIFLVHVEKN